MEKIRLLITGADYGLGTIGTCLGPPPAGGPPFIKKKENAIVTVKKVWKMTRMGMCRLCHTLCKS